MSDPNNPNPTPPPAGDPPPATPPAPEPKAAEKKLLDDLKKAQAKAKELETKLAEALPYVERFKGHEDAKALEAQREAEARARHEAEARTRQDIEARRERAILKGLIGVVPQGDSELGDFALWKLSTDPSIVFDSESGNFTGLSEALEALKASPRFAAGKPGEPPRKPAPGLPDTKKADDIVDQKFAGVKTYTDLMSLGMPAVNEFYAKHPETYAALVAAHETSRSSYRPEAVFKR